jgi:hypothetical protein
MLLQHVRRPARALRGARSRVGVLRAGRAGGAAKFAAYSPTRDARRVADDGLDEAGGAQLALEVEGAEARLAHALAVVDGDGLVLQVALNLVRTSPQTVFSVGPKYFVLQKALKPYKKLQKCQKLLANLGSEDTV